MNEWYEQAKSKLEAEKAAGSYDRYASAMKNAVCEALDGFCRQAAAGGEGRTGVDGHVLRGLLC